tara:strand:+ start:17190 stop:19091 length:1902 start_codon:yes stop_codon:yes gene_type:complete
MCGITGFLSLNKSTSYNEKDVIMQMCNTINHRGPDSTGFYSDSQKGVYLGHNRLSILELSELGNQPMFSKSERYVIVFNGEIYNHLDIRNEIDLKNSINWIGKSDTETLLSAIEFYGIKLALIKCKGMFSLALWDKFENKLVIARDRMGEKPMYYGIQKNTFLFGSELKSLVLHPEFLAKQNYDSLSTFLSLGYIPNPYTIWDGIKKLEPGQLITININSNNSFNLDIDSYWSLSDVIISSQKNLFLGTSSQAIKKLESLIIKSVKGQMLSDVPLGAFLSGGIDSSLIVAIMQSVSNKPVKTFSIGFEDKKYNEANFAKSIANHLKTDHSELYLNEKDSLDAIPLLAQMFDEPFGDSSAIPTYLVSKLAKKHVTVSLSGDGGDELFGGYSRYHNSKIRSIYNLSQLLPTGLINNFSLKNSIFGDNFNDKINFALSLSQSENFKSFYTNFISQWRKSPLKFSTNTQQFGISNSKVELIADYMHKMMALDSSIYLPDDILTKVDRTAMSVSLETRVPLLDHNIVEFAWQLPIHMKIKNGKSKWILKKLLSKFIPNKLTERPKMGFGIPLATWLRGPLRDWAESLINPVTISTYGVFNEKIITLKWNQFLKGDDRLTHPIWLILTYQSWIINHKIK